MKIPELKTAFETIFHKPAEIACFSPAKVNMIGEHVDYNRETIIPFVLKLGTYLLIAENNESKIKLKSLNHPDKDFSLNLTQDIKVGHNSWINNPLSIISQFSKQGLNLKKGYDFLFWENSPKDLGLSISTSIELVTTFALTVILKNKFNKSSLVEISRLYEKEFTSVDRGMIDQFAYINGIKNQILSLNDETSDYKLVSSYLEEVKIIITDSTTSGKYNKSTYNKRVSECQLAIKQLRTVFPVSSLAKLSIDEFIGLEYAITDSLALKRARHVVSEEQRSKVTIQAIKRGDINLLGKLMNASHLSLHDDFEVVGCELNSLVNETWKIQGVIGSRMIGDGQRGCSISIVRCEYIEDFKITIGHIYKDLFGTSPNFYTAVLDDEVCRIFKYFDSSLITKLQL